MALKIKNERIIGTIDNLEDKLEGKLPVDILELLYLINSWGRIDFFYTQYLDENVKIENYRSKECYDLSKLDVSKITNMDYIFKYSLFDGDISKWDVSNVTSMKEMFFSVESFNQPIGNWDVSSVTNMLDMFCVAKDFNSPLNSWDVSNVTNMNGMFYGTKKFNSDISNWDTSNVIDMSYMFAYTKEFNQNISSWNINNVVNMGSMFFDTKSFNQNISSWNLDNVKNGYFMFNKAKAFLDKYNNGNPLPEDTDKIKEWFNLNRERMNEINLKEKHEKEIDDFFTNITDIYSTNRIGLHENLLTECNKQFACKKSCL